MAITKEILDELLKDYQKPEDLFGQSGLLQQGRPLEKRYVILYLDALVVKVKQDGWITNRSIYRAVGINLQGRKEVLGFWSAENEGAKFWLSVAPELNNQGIEDVLIACVGVLKGFPEAIESIFPRAQVQLRIIHLLRNSLRLVSWKERKAVAAALKPIYTAATAEQAEQHLTEFDEVWGCRYPMIGRIWRANWARVIQFLQFLEEIRRMIYTTSAVESLNKSLRKIIKNRSLFPNDEAIFKSLYLALKKIEKKFLRKLLRGPRLEAATKRSNAPNSRNSTNQAHPAQT
jgi:putative transposase